MATRRIVSSEKTALDKDNADSAPSSAAPAPSVPPAVVFKLLAFTATMVIAPIGSYFLSVNTIFQGNSTYAGALAAIIANIVLLSYVFVAFNEDSGEESKKEK